MKKVIEYYKANKQKIEEIASDIGAEDLDETEKGLIVLFRAFADVIKDEVREIVREEIKANTECIQRGLEREKGERNRIEGEEVVKLLEDPRPDRTSVCKRLGRLGLTSMSDIKGWGKQGNKICIYSIGRAIDTGWEIKGDEGESEEIKVLGEIMEECGFQFPFRERGE